MHDFRWLRLILVAIISIFAFVSINIYEDPGNIFHHNAKSAAESIMAGNETFIGSGNADERVMREYMIKNMPHDTSTLTFGSSTAFGIRQEQVGNEPYYNLALSGSNFYDILSQFGLLEINDIQYDRVIITVDTYFFDESKYSMRNPEMKVYADYMIDCLNDRSPVPPSDAPTNYRKLFEQAFSATYFQSSIDFIRSNNSVILPQKRWGVVDSSTEDLQHYLPDGSLVYGIGYRSKTVEDVINHANSYDIESEFSKGEHISENSKDIFEKLIDYLDNRDVEIVFYICPLAPTLWDRIQNDEEADQYFILDEMEIFAHEVAERYGIRITGSFNPYNIGIQDDDFWDSRHIRHERLDNFFDFSN